MEKQETLETTLTQLTKDVKTLQSSYENLKSKAKENGHEWWQKGATQGIRVAVDNWLYPNDKVYEQAIRKELEELCPDRMEHYNKVSKWEALYCKIENMYRILQISWSIIWTFHHTVFEHVFKKKVSPTVNSESSESDIASWKLSEEVKWCFENLDMMNEEEDKTYLQMVAKKVFGRQPTRNQHAVAHAILHNLFNPEITKLNLMKNT
ncbi:20954_t:CDS:2 [Dentiscutata erythropus]|uniref:20954_t:CDS:1 n=1 Tax=Dentiscutata erythropus TaxID=1348616 RepID=A0A9N8WF14_9GLOM|nr:20954_t:CDS:2 [Dentiscutata erythropus]